MLAYDSPRPGELMSCVGRLCKDYLYLYNSTTQWLLSATNPNSTTHNGSQHRRGCLFPSPIKFSLPQQWVWCHHQLRLQLYVKPIQQPLSDIRHLATGLKQIQDKLFRFTWKLANIGFTVFFTLISYNFERGRARGGSQWCVYKALNW